MNHSNQREYIMIPDAFKSYVQFINWISIDKNKKIPIDAMTGKYINMLDPKNWKTANDVCQYVNTGLGVGFVFTNNDPFFFLDIDDKHSVLANILYCSFMGCHTQVSHSGNGLHIFGSGTYSKHSCRNTDVGLEFYTTGRFVALTGTDATGSASFNPQSQIDQIITTYLSPKIPSEAIEI